METKFTNGKWVYDELNGSVVIDGIEVMRFDDCDIDADEMTGRANCQLIAAAPDLYAELERLDPTNPALAKARGEA